jgi:hypothetical protein
MSYVQELAPIAVHLVADKDRFTFLPSLFGHRFMVRGEELVYRWLDALTEDYTGGYWNFYALTNGGFYMAPAAPKRMRLAVGGNGFSGEMSGDAAGVELLYSPWGKLRPRAKGVRTSMLLLTSTIFFEILLPAIRKVG